MNCLPLTSLPRQRKVHNPYGSPLTTLKEKLTGHSFHQPPIHGSRAEQSGGHTPFIPPFTLKRVVVKLSNKQCTALRTRAPVFFSDAVDLRLTNTLQPVAPLLSPLTWEEEASDYAALSHFISLPCYEKAGAVAASKGFPQLQGLMAGDSRLCSYTAAAATPVNSAQQLSAWPPYALEAAWTTTAASRVSPSLGVDSNTTREGLSWSELPDEQQGVELLHGCLSPPPSGAQIYHHPHLPLCMFHFYGSTAAQVADEWRAEVLRKEQQQRPLDAPSAAAQQTPQRPCQRAMLVTPVQTQVNAIPLEEWQDVCMQEFQVWGGLRHAATAHLHYNSVAQLAGVPLTPLWNVPLGLQQAAAAVKASIGAATHVANQERFMPQLPCEEDFLPEIGMTSGEEATDTVAAATQRTKKGAALRGGGVEKKEERFYQTSQQLPNAAADDAVPPGCAECRRSKLPCSSRSRIRALSPSRGATAKEAAGSTREDLPFVAAACTPPPDATLCPRTTIKGTHDTAVPPHTPVDCPVATRSFELNPSLRDQLPLPRCCSPQSRRTAVVVQNSALNKDFQEAIELMSALDNASNSRCEAAVCSTACDDATEVMNQIRWLELLVCCRNRENHPQCRPAPSSPNPLLRTDLAGTAFGDAGVEQISGNGISASFTLMVSHQTAAGLVEEVSHRLKEKERCRRVEMDSLWGAVDHHPLLTQR